MLPLMLAMLMLVMLCAHPKDIKRAATELAKGKTVSNLALKVGWATLGQSDPTHTRTHCVSSVPLCVCVFVFDYCLIL